MTHKRGSDHIIAGRCYKFGAFLGALEANLIASSYKYSFCIFFFALFCVFFFFFFMLGHRKMLLFFNIKNKHNKLELSE